MSSSNKNIKSLHKSIEKLTKVALIKMEKQQESDAIKIIEEIHLIFTLFLQKKRNNLPEFTKQFCYDSNLENHANEVNQIEFEFISLFVETNIKFWKSAYNSHSYNISRKTISLFNIGFLKFQEENLLNVNYESVEEFYKCNQLFLEFINSVISETSLVDDFKNCADILYDYIKWITDLKYEILKHYLKLLNSNISPDLISRSILIESESKGFYIFFDSFFRLWRNSFDKKIDITGYTITIVENILTLLLSQERSKDYVNISNNFIHLIQSINFELYESNKKVLYSSEKAAYVWFFKVVYHDKFDLSLMINLQISLYISMKFAISNNNKRQFSSFIEFIVNGMYYPSYGLLPDYNLKLKLSKGKDIHDYFDVKDRLIKASSEALTLGDFKKTQLAFDEFKNFTIEFIEEDITDNGKLIDEYKKYIEKEFKYNSLEQTVIWLGVFCLFQKRYDFIEELLFYNQPKDSAAHWSNRDINPLNISKILTLYLRRHDLEREAFLFWEGHHDFSSYYLTYISILLLNAINQNQRKGQEWNNEYNSYLENGSETPQLLQSYIYSFTEIKEHIVYLKKERTVVEKCGLSIKLAESAIILLNNIIIALEQKITIVKTNASIDNDKVNKFIDNVYDQYWRGGSIRNIINYYKRIEDNNSPMSPETYLPFSVNEIMEKSYFAKEDEGMYVGFTSAFSRRFIFYENLELKNRIIKESNKKSNIEPSTVLTELEALGALEDKVLIFSNLYPEYEIFGSNKEFISRDSIPQTEEFAQLIEFVGRYKGADVFSYYDDTNWKQLLIIKKDLKNTIGTIKYYIPADTSNFNVKEHFYWKLSNLAIDNILVEDIIKKKPYWLLEKSSIEEEQRKFLLEQINIIILYKLSYDLPEDFEGWFFTIKN